MKMHLNPLAFPLALALAVSASMPTGSGKGPEIDAGSGNTRTSHQRIALAALDPIVDAARPCVFRGTSTGTETSKKRLLRWKFDTRVSFDPESRIGGGREGT
ncbi:hypothetical protein EDB92DRAFT_1815033 [Lactarius akahatsu]|uniref:Uncharacterized protein n=1 Tax=Lactarius akahatsu TaxID=416441 RepID=A0AAD4QF24_9AGAM|nr:hypothetical protein EDB92DRAFT_1815033 [Lactarius akahatsu]